MSSPIPPEVAKEIADQVFAGHKIEAIKRYRDYSGRGLKESKDFVEALEAELRASDPTKFAPVTPGKGCFSTTALFAFGTLAILLAVVLLMS